jgi:hypothetical protein
MIESHDPVVLDLEHLPAEVELSRPVALAIALAASVVLDRMHGERDHYPAELCSGGEARPAHLRRLPVDDTARNTYADPQEATEEGGEGVAVLLASRVLERIVFRRLPKGTGADYLMRDPHGVEGDQYERLECSAIADGREPTAARLRGKLAQLARFPSHPPGWAVVTGFRTHPIGIHFGSWPR